MDPAPGSADRGKGRGIIARDGIGQEGDGFGVGRHGCVAGQIAHGQLYVVGGSLQPPAFLKVLVLVRADQKRVVVPRQRWQGDSAEGRGQRGAQRGQFVINA
ncbi:MAG: hypothetical protein C0524_00680 [Rhodobacter sp.]|nr:hypothetical protein [Rhodobacter sp.]